MDIFQIYWSIRSSRDVLIYVTPIQ
uniref:Uncharacterized protein n=1 Tax=Lepeophtheirus salmonis TaxID=72036 RepID=A0A0K2TXZ1_LEPSM